MAIIPKVGPRAPFAEELLTYKRPPQPDGPGPNERGVIARKTMRDRHGHEQGRFNRTGAGTQLLRNLRGVQIGQLRQEAEREGWSFPKADRAGRYKNADLDAYVARRNERVAAAKLTTVKRRAAGYPDIGDYSKAGEWEKYEAAVRKFEQDEAEIAALVKHRAITLVDSGQATIAEVADLIGRSRQQVHQWVHDGGCFDPRGRRKAYLKSLWQHWSTGGAPKMTGVKS
jgi:hypothetical protein